MNRKQKEVILYYYDLDFKHFKVVGQIVKIM